MICLVLAFTCVLAQPAEQERIGTLIRALDDEALEVRDEAGRELLAIGEPAIPALEQILKESASAELKARATSIRAGIRRELRRKTFVGGKPLGGLSARIEAELRKDGTVLLTVEIMNVGTTPATLAEPRHAEVYTPARERAYTSAHGRFVVTQLTGRRPEVCQHGDSCGSGPAVIPATLAPGESRTHSTVVRMGEGSGGLLPGDHEAVYTYFAKSRDLLGGATEDLVSNPVTFSIKD